MKGQLKYKKPVIKKEKKMNFPASIIQKATGRLECRQCSSCHGCR